MSNRLKRVFSTVLCAAVMLTMTAVPGTVFAENVDGSEAAEQTEVQEPANENENEADAVASDQNEGEAETEDEAQTSADSGAAMDLIVAKSAEIANSVTTTANSNKNSNKNISVMSLADGVSVTASPGAGVCPGKTITLKANVDESRLFKYTYKWYKEGATDSVGKGTSLVLNNKNQNGTYYVEVEEKTYIPGIRVRIKKSDSIECTIYDDHDWASDFTIDKSATCTENGSKSKHCTRPGCDEKTEITSIATQGHQEAWKAVGNNDGKCEKYCKKCNEILDGPVDHELIYAVSDTDPQKHTRKCARCNTSLLLEDHEYGELVVDKASTCTEAGSKSKHCGKCGAKAEVTEIPALGHDMKKTDASAASCTETGNNEYYTCARCHKVYKDAAGAAETTVEKETLAATGHDLEATAQKDATCTETGMKAYWKCRKCQKLFSDENAVTEIESPEVIPANAHKMKRVDKHDATCTEDGHEEYWKCEECGYLSSDREGRNEIINPVKISATGHDLGEWKVTKEATVQAKGIKERACRKCEYKETAEIPMLTADKNTDVKKAADKSAETGDDMNIALYGLLALAAAAGAAGTLYRRKTN